MGMHIAGRHARHSQTPCKRSQSAIASAIVAGVGTLELHAQALCPERVEQAAGRWLVEDAATTGPPRPTDRPTDRGVADRRSVGAPRPAYETPGMVPHRLPRDRRLAQHARPGRRRRGGRRDRAVADEGAVADRPTDPAPGPVAGARLAA